MPQEVELKKFKHQYEVHCPSCGVLLRDIPEKNKREACPDCGAKDAIFLSYNRFTYEWKNENDGVLIRIKEKKTL